MLKNEDDTLVLFDTLSNTSLHNTRPSSLRQIGKVGVLEVEPTTHLQGQLDSLTRKVNQLLSHGAFNAHTIYTICYDYGHNSDECPTLKCDSFGQVNDVQGFFQPNV